MSIHQNYKRLNESDRFVVDRAFDEARDLFVVHGRNVDNADPSERLIEAIATFLFESDGAARVGEGYTLSAPVGETHKSY